MRETCWERKVATSSLSRSRLCAVRDNESEGGSARRKALIRSHCSGVVSGDGEAESAEEAAITLGVVCWQSQDSNQSATTNCTRRARWCSQFLCISRKRCCVNLFIEKVLSGSKLSDSPEGQAAAIACPQKPENIQ